MGDATDPLSLSRLLLYGSLATRASLAAGLLEADGAADWAMLAATVHSREQWLLRARCLELLGMAAAGGDEATAKVIFAALFGAEEVS